MEWLGRERQAKMERADGWMTPGFLIQETERMELTLAELEKTKGCVGLGNLWKSMIVWLWYVEFDIPIRHLSGH